MSFLWGGCPVYEMGEWSTRQNYEEIGDSAMATTGELRAIIEELELVDIGDAASYLGEEAIVGDESFVSVQPALLPVTASGCPGHTAYSSSESTN
jgi:hypothetical protein